MNEKACTAVTIGTIIERRDLGFKQPIAVKVQYLVDGKEYVIDNNLKYRSKFFKLGSLPIGQMKIPEIGDNQVGTSVLVAYDPERPDEAYLLDNQGAMNA